MKDVIYAFNELKKVGPKEISSLYVYFETNYIGLFINEEAKVRSVPLFPIVTWNVHNRAVKNLPRSNNSLEAWHRSLAQDINSHPFVNKCIKHFIREQHVTEISFEQIKSGFVFEREKSEIKKDNSIKDLHKTYDKKNFLIFMDNLFRILKSY